ncbi:MAG TPA: response regulator transcription factor [Chloroflexota bacterium]|jgi:DNA-binding response OmpR family regulator|nr:response regulator transcription factor [Chloroflexota bacterium]
MAPTTEPLHILVIEDDQAVRLSLRVAFERQGFRVEEAATGGAGLECTAQERPHVVILDLMLPDIDGIEVFHRLRRMDAELPVVMLTARGDELDRITGLELGADDYVTKPFSPRELIARVRAVGRRSRQGADAAAHTPPDLVILPAARTVSVGGRPVVLTRTEFDLLAFLARHAGSVVRRDALVRGVWGYVTEGESRLLDSHIRHVRAKIEPEPGTPRYLLTVRDVGYRLSLTPAT